VEVFKKGLLGRKAFREKKGGIRKRVVARQDRRSMFQQLGPVIEN